jgi:glutathione S-transferase
MSDKVELFSYEACPFAQRTRMILIEKGIAYELTEIDVYQRPAWFRDVSPYGKVPLLRHDGRAIYESAIINEYLDETFPDPPMMPPDAYGRAQARIWMDYCDTRYLPVAHRLLVEREQPGKLAENRAKLTETMRFMEHEGLRKLGDGPYWMGAAATLVDFQYLPFFERFAVYEELAGAEWPDDCTRLRRWYETMSQRPSFLETRHTLDFHLEVQRRRARPTGAAAARATRN